MANNVSLTAEQQAVMNCTDKFVLVSACPGSGKSTTLRAMRKDGDISLSFSRADAESAKNQLSGENVESGKYMRTLDSLALEALRIDGNECNTDGTDYFNGSPSNNSKLNSFSRIFYGGIGDNAFDAVNTVMKSMNKILTGYSRAVPMKTLGKYVSDYASTGILPISKKERERNPCKNSINEFILNWMRFQRYIAAVNQVQELFGLDADWNLMDTYADSKAAARWECIKRLLFNGSADVMRQYLGLDSDVSENDMRQMVAVDYARSLMGLKTNLIKGKLADIISNFDMHVNEVDWCLAWMLVENWIQIPVKNHRGGLTAPVYVDCIVRACLGLEFTREEHYNRVDDWAKKKEYPFLLDKKPIPLSGNREISLTYNISELSTAFYQLIENDIKDAADNSKEPTLLQDVADNMKFSRILVDEGQDMSEVQAKIIERFALDTNVKVVIFYDGDQSIYGFRNAVGNIAEFGEYKHATLMNLTYNFRSTAEIIAVANALRNKIQITSGKTIVPMRTEHGPIPEIRGYASAHDEALAISQWVKAKLHIWMQYDEENPSLKPVQYENIAIIVRTHSVADLIIRVLKSQLNVGVAIADKPNVKDKHGNKIRHHVYVLTDHAAKGREYSCVWVAGIDNKFWPLMRDKTKLNQREKTALHQDELKMLFVAVTRARNELVMSYAQFRTSGAETITNKDGQERENKYGQQKTGPSMFIKKSRHTYIPDNIVKRMTISKLDYRDEALKELDDRFKDFVNGKYSNIRVRDAFREDDKYIKRAKRIDECADTLDIGFFKQDDSDIPVAGITNYHRCRDRWCGIDQAMDAVELQNQLDLAMKLIQCSSRSVPVYEVQWERAGKDDRADAYGFKLDEIGNRIPVLDANDRMILVYATDAHGNVLIDANGRKIQKKSNIRTVTIPGRTNMYPSFSYTYMPNVMNDYASVAWNHMRENGVNIPTEHVNVNKGLNGHDRWLFLTITQPNIKLEDVLTKKSYGATQGGNKQIYRNPIQEQIYRVMNALNPSRRRNWARRNINGVWITCEITVKEDESGQVWLHVHCHCLLDMNKNYWNREYMRQGLKWVMSRNTGKPARGSNGKPIPVYKRDAAGNYIYKNGKKVQDSWEEWATYLQKSMQLDEPPIVRVESVSRDSRGSNTGCTDLGTMFIELTKYATKPAELFSCDKNDPDHYVSRENVNNVVRVLAEAEQGIRMKRAYGSLKFAMDEAKRIIVALQPNKEQVGRTSVVYDAHDKRYLQALDNDASIASNAYKSSAASSADPNDGVSGMPSTSPQFIPDDGYYAAVDADAASVDDLLPYESDADEQIITYVTDSSDADSMSVNESDDSGVDDDNVDSDDSSLDGDSDSGYEKYDELFE